MKRAFLISFLIGVLAYTPGHLNAEAVNIGSKSGNLGRTFEDVKVRGTLVAGVLANEPPLEFVDEKGVLNGIDVDIAEVLAKEILGKKDKVEFVLVRSGKMLGLLKSGKIDMLSHLPITEDKEKEIAFSVPYFVSGYLILVERESKISKYRDLAGKNIAIIQGTKGDRIVEELFPASKWIQFDHDSEALQSLREHKVDAIVERDVAAFYAEEKDKNLRVIDFRPIHPSLLGFGVRKGDQEWIDFLDITLLKMITTGEYLKLLEKWFGEARGELLELTLKKEIQLHSGVGGSGSSRMRNLPR